MPRVRDALAASDLGDVAEGESGRVHEPAERDVLDLGEDFAFERP